MKFYSEVTKKLYETEKELIMAEKEAVAAEEKKLEAAKAKKADALKVEDAFKANNEAKREYNAKVIAARKAYNETLVAAKKAFDEAVNDATKIKENAENVYDAALKEFTAKHPEGFHITLKDGDNVMTVSSQGNVITDFSKEYNNLFNQLFNIWKI